ncbi:MAG: metallophosphoesterase [Acidimicrobiales bacterium]
MSDRVFVAGDWHGNIAWAATCCNLAKRHRCSRILQLGDFGIWESRKDRRYFNSLEIEAKRADITIYVIGGNHENYDTVDSIEIGAPDADGFFFLRPHLRWIRRGHRWEWDGIRFGAIGGAFSVDYKGRVPGVSWWPLREEARPADVERLGTDPLDVFICHDAPLGASPSAQVFVSEDVAQQVRGNQSLLLSAVERTRPKLVLHGHWHCRNSQAIHLPDRLVRVEGLESDQEAGPASWGILDLKTFEFRDGKGVASFNGAQEWQQNSQPRCTDGPAIVEADGTQKWYQDGRLHRTNGPAIVEADGTQKWYQDGKRHRTDGPAIVWADGSKAWWRDDQLHRTDGPAVVWPDGTKEWWENTQLHRTDGPAIVRADGTQEWWENGQLHRTDGPAVVWANGYKEWWENGQLHRTDGPAIVKADGTQEWWRDDQLHRTDGPAVVWANGYKEWWQNGKRHCTVHRRPSSC